MYALVGWALFCSKINQQTESPTSAKLHFRQHWPTLKVKHWEFILLHIIYQLTQKIVSQLIRIMPHLNDMVVIVQKPVNQSMFQTGLLKTCLKKPISNQGFFSFKLKYP